MPVASTQSSDEPQNGSSVPGVDTRDMDLGEAEARLAKEADDASDSNFIIGDLALRLLEENESVEHDEDKISQREIADRFGLDEGRLAQCIKVSLYFPYEVRVEMWKYLTNLKWTHVKQLAYDFHKIRGPVRLSKAERESWLKQLPEPLQDPELEDEMLEGGRINKRTRMVVEELLYINEYTDGRRGRRGEAGMTVSEIRAYADGFLKDARTFDMRIVKTVLTFFKVKMPPALIGIRVKIWGLYREEE